MSESHGFVIAGSMTFDPAKHDQCVKAMAEVVEPSRLEEGCSSYGFYADPSTPGRFIVFEHWLSQEAFDRHCQTPHYLGFVGSIGDLGMSGAEVSRYDVSAVSSLT
jgi:quinol monooxygenase YgiN